jgi:hypothetical protein
MGSIYPVRFAQENHPSFLHQIIGLLRLRNHCPAIWQSMFRQRINILKHPDQFNDRIEIAEDSHSLR